MTTSNVLHHIIHASCMHGHMFKFHNSQTIVFALMINLLKLPEFTSSKLCAFGSMQL